MERDFFAATAAVGADKTRTDAEAGSDLFRLPAGFCSPVSSRDSVLGVLLLLLFFFVDAVTGASETVN